MKVMLLAIYPSRSYANSAMEEIGIASITAHLRKNGIETILKSFSIDDVDYEYIVAEKPDVIGITVYYSWINAAIEFTKRVKLLIPNVIVFWGGYTPSMYGVEILKKWDCIDYIMQGEGENSVLKFVTSLYNNDSVTDTPGLVYRKHNQIIINNNPNMTQEEYQQLESPALDLLKYGKGIALVSTARGCMHNCTFCCSNKYWKVNGGHWRGMPMERTAYEIYRIYNEKHILYYEIINDSFEDPYCNSQYIIKFIEKMEEYKLPIGFNISMRAEGFLMLDTKTITRLKKIGLIQIFIGIESANAQDLKLYAKSIQVEQNIAALIKAKEHDILIDIGFININPFSTLDGLKNNLEFLHNYNYIHIPYFTARLMVFQNTAILNLIKKKNLLSDDPFVTPFCYNYSDPLIAQVVKTLLNSNNLMHNNIRKMYSTLPPFSSLMSHIILNCFLNENRLSQNQKLYEYNLIKERIKRTYYMFGDIVYDYYKTVLSVAKNNELYMLDEIIKSKSFDYSIFSTIEKDISNSINQLKSLLELIGSEWYE